jgi:hypothetical protein
MILISNPDSVSNFVIVANQWTISEWATTNLPFQIKEQQRNAMTAIASAPHLSQLMDGNVKRSVSPKRAISPRRSMRGAQLMKKCNSALPPATMDRMMTIIRNELTKGFCYFCAFPFQNSINPITSLDCLVVWFVGCLVRQSVVGWLVS